MTTPGGSGYESVSFGTDPRPAASHGRRFRVAVVGIVVGLAAGLVVGDGAGQHLAAAQRSAAPGAVILADAVPETVSSGDHGPVFSLRLLNTGDQAATLESLSFVGMDSHLVGAPGQQLAPHAWTALQFSAPPDCFAGVPETVSSLRVTLREGGGVTRQRVVLPGEGGAVLGYQHAICDPVPLRSSRDLLGVWLLEEPYALFPEGKGVDLFKFHADGRLTEDPEGLLLLQVPHGVDATYSLHGRHLVTRVTGGYQYGCRPGDRAVWRVGVIHGWGAPVSDVGERLTLAWLRGRCPSRGEGEVWVLQKILAGVD